ncbi:hypothetical protein ACJ5H2_19800 [Nocardioides sp. R1-1]|uniref:hypothetical protein n=1 Tax=Nocardioides sp. R1-1 TaxID=3383502 RepID=UPI0038D1E609
MSLPPPPPAPPSGWGPPGPPSPYGAPPPRGRATTVALMVGGAALALLVLVGVGMGAFLLAGGADDDEGATRATDPPSTTGPSSGSPTGSPTGSPSSGPSTPYTPSDDTADDIHNDVRVAELPGDWNFRLGTVEHHATLVRSVDHAGCAPVESGSALSAQRCEYAAQWVFDALGGKVRLSHLFLVFDTERHAKAAQGALEEKDLDLPAGSIHAPFVQGTWSSRVYGNIVAVTVGTSRTAVPEKKLSSLVNHLGADFTSALRFRF